MEKVTFIELENSLNELVEYAIIDRGNGEYTSMLKETYEAQQAAQVEHLTEIVPLSD